MCNIIIKRVLTHRTAFVTLTLENSENAIEKVNDYYVLFCRKYVELTENNIPEHADLSENSLDQN